MLPPTDRRVPQAAPPEQPITCSARCFPERQAACTMGRARKGPRNPEHGSTTLQLAGIVKSGAHRDGLLCYPALTDRTRVELQGRSEMADVTVKKVSEMDSVYDGAMVRARASLGVKSFGMQVENLPPNWDGYPEHDEAGSGQEEVFLALKGSARLIVGAEEFQLEPGVLARVGKGEKRRIVPGPEGVQILALGGVPGEAYVPPEWSEVGATPPVIKD